jgi:hypothetical protein
MADAKTQGPEILYPDWQHEFLAALLELDGNKLLERVQAAETAIFNRLQRQAIDDALASLRVLKREKLGFPDWEKHQSHAATS